MKLAVLFIVVLLISSLFSLLRSGMTQEGVERALGVIEKAVDEGVFPGAVVLIGKDGRVVAQKAFGDAMIVPEKREMREDTHVRSSFPDQVCSHSNIQ